MQVIEKRNTHILEVNNLGPIHHARLIIKVGLNELLGENGVGKTHILKALARAFGDNDIAVPLRDGATKGSVSLDGAPLLVLGKVNRTTGEAEIGFASTSPLSTLVDPLIKNVEAAAKARISALLQLIEVTVKEETVKSLVMDDGDAVRGLEESTGIEPLTKLDIVNIADIVRRKMHDFKRDHEKLALTADAEMLAANPERPERVTETSVEDAETAYNEAVRTHERLSGQATQRATHEKERASIRETIGTRPDVAAATELRNKADATVNEWEEKIAALDRQLVAARAELKTAEAAQEAAGKTLGEVELAAATYDKRKLILDSDISGATESDVEAADITVTKAKDTLDAARASATYRAALLKREEAKGRKEQEEALAKKFESIALAVTGQLGNVLKEAGLSNLTVDEGQLCVIHESGALEAFTRLSFGQKTRIGAELLAKRSDSGSVIALDPQFWAGLSPSNQKEAAEIFVEAGLFVLTEMPANGGLRVEHFRATVDSPVRPGEEQIAMATYTPEAAADDTHGTEIVRLGE